MLNKTNLIWYIVRPPTKAKHLEEGVNTKSDFPDIVHIIQNETH